MDECGLRKLITHVKAGRLSRRGFVQMMVGLGLTAPMARQMLASAGVAQAQSKLVYKPTKRGGGGAFRTLWWQGATLLNPLFAVDDVVFNWEFAADPASATYDIATYKDIKVEKIDSHTVRVVFPKPTPF